MKVLTTKEQLVRQLRRLFNECSSCEIAVAWASKGFEGFELLSQHRSKISRMIVGIHFYQTDPEFIEEFITDERVRFIMSTDGVFHPKVYLFTRKDGEREFVIGRPNFTSGGFQRNEEVAVLITSQDVGAESAIHDVRKGMEMYWQNREKFPVMTGADLAAYREARERKKSLLKALGSQYGKPKSNGGKHPLKVKVLQMTWPQYFEMVKNEPPHGSHDNSFQGRLEVIRAVQNQFQISSHFEDIEESWRNRIAGIAYDDDGKAFDWFGTMKPARIFKTAIADKYTVISEALDAIPENKPVSNDHYSKFIQRFRVAFPNGGDGVATATRLLAMKMPDYFLCFNDPNKKRLYDEFGFEFKKHVDYEQYWDLIIEKVITAKKSARLRTNVRSFPSVTKSSRRAQTRSPWAIRWRLR